MITTGKIGIFSVAGIKHFINIFLIVSFIKQRAEIQTIDLETIDVEITDVETIDVEIIDIETGHRHIITKSIRYIGYYRGTLNTLIYGNCNVIINMLILQSDLFTPAQLLTSLQSTKLILNIKLTHIINLIPTSNLSRKHSIFCV